MSTTTNEAERLLDLCLMTAYAARSAAAVQRAPCYEALLAELRRLAAVEVERDNLRYEVAEMKREFANRGGMLELVKQRRDELEAENEALRADAERYRWLRGDGAKGFGHPRWACWQVQAWGGNPLHWQNVAGEALDQAIDESSNG